MATFLWQYTKRLCCELARLPLLLIKRVSALHSGDPLKRFMLSFTDSRDAGAVLVSHFSLLTGCAVPVWLMLTGQQTDMPWHGRRPATGLPHVLVGTEDMLPQNPAELHFCIGPSPVPFARQCTY